MAERKKMVKVKVVCLKVLYHPSNFLPSLKKHPVYRVENSFWVEKKKPKKGQKLKKKTKKPRKSQKKSKKDRKKRKKAQNFKKAQKSLNFFGSFSSGLFKTNFGIHGHFFY